MEGVQNYGQRSVGPHVSGRQDSRDLEVLGLRRSKENCEEGNEQADRQAAGKTEDLEMSRAIFRMWTSDRHQF